MAVAAPGIVGRACGGSARTRHTGEKEMPKIEIAQIPAQQIASYPKEFASVISGAKSKRSARRQA